MAAVELSAIHRAVAPHLEEIAPSVRPPFSTTDGTALRFAKITRVYRKDTTITPFGGMGNVQSVSLGARFGGPAAVPAAINPIQSFNNTQTSGPARCWWQPW